MEESWAVSAFWDLIILIKSVIILENFCYVDLTSKKLKKKCMELSV